jgi:uncharacterized protein (TIGR03066 family)
MRAILWCALAVLASGSTLSGDDKKDGKPGAKKDEQINVKMLIGTWKLNDPSGEPQGTLEFKGHGRVTHIVTADGAENKVAGSYKIEGSKLHVDVGTGPSLKSTYRVAKLTDVEMVWTADEKDGPRRMFTRLSAARKEVTIDPKVLIGNWESRFDRVCVTLELSGDGAATFKVKWDGPGTPLDFLGTEVEGTASYVLDGQSIVAKIKTVGGTNLEEQKLAGKRTVIRLTDSELVTVDEDDEDEDHPLTFTRSGDKKAKDKEVEKIDVEKLLGKWELKEDSVPRPPVVCELRKDGKLTATLMLKGGWLFNDDIDISGTYKIDGNKIVLTLTAPDSKMTLTVLRQTYVEVVVVDEDGKTEATFRRAGAGGNPDGVLDARTAIAKWMLVGKWKWEPRKEDEGPIIVMDFQKDGKIFTGGTVGGKIFSNEGTYTLDTNKLITVPTGMGRRETFTIIRLTDTELVGTTDKGTEEKLVRVKNK